MRQRAVISERAFGEVPVPVLVGIRGTARRHSAVEPVQTREEEEEEPGLGFRPGRESGGPSGR